ncbi:MAG: NUDIX hydrolase [Rhizobacter sp.]|nr:NUDIX hydrolase [Chlorobiales bacterium]
MRQDRVQLPTGGIVEEFFVWEYPPWVNVLGITKAEEIVLIRQFRYGVGKVYFELPAGTVDLGDATAGKANDSKTEDMILRAARRELLEETGFGGGSWQLWMTLAANPAIQTNLTYTFLATGVELLQPQALEPTEEITVHLLRPGEVRSVLLGDEMIQALHAAPLLKYLLLNMAL